MDKGAVINKKSSKREFNIIAICSKNKNAMSISLCEYMYKIFLFFIIQATIFQKYSYSCK